MFEIDYKNLKKGRRFPLIFLIVGIICALIFGAIFAISTIKRNSLDRQIYATSIDPNEQIDNEHHLVYSPIYHYTVEGKEYTCSDNTSSSKRPSSEGIVYYNSKDPSKCMTDYAHKINYYLLIGVGIGAIFIGIGAFMMVKNSKKINKLKKLATEGKLIKGIPYHLEDTGTIVNNKRIQKIVINYTGSNGFTRKLEGDPRFDYKESDEDGLVDLLIDPNDEENYFIDFEIKYSGNVQVETYNGPKTDPYAEQMNQVNEQAQQVAETVTNVVQGIESIEKKAEFINNALHGTITIEHNTSNDNNNNDINNNQ